jgi:hypothetical protein
MNRTPQGLVGTGQRVRVSRRRSSGQWIFVAWDPIELPGGRKLVTLRDAAQYITELPKVEDDVEPSQAAMEALLLVAEHGRSDDACTDRA